MENYKSRSGKVSGVIAYEFGDDYIKVKFTNKDTYKYPESLNSPSIIAEMKSCATNQIGLSTFISQNKPSFSEKY